jgi:hypothetical protein
MRQDIEAGYPNDYYKLRRRVGMEIKEQLQKYIIVSSKGGTIDPADVQVWAQELSIRSGIPMRGIIRLFQDISPASKEWFT